MKFVPWNDSSLIDYTTSHPTVYFYNRAVEEEFTDTVDLILFVKVYFASIRYFEKYEL